VVNTGYGQYVQQTVNGVPYIYIYASDTQAPAAGTTSACRVSFAAARAPLGEVLSAASAGKVSAWRKYYAGAWGEPALGGRSTDLRPRQLKLSFDVSYNAYSGKYLLAATTPRPDGQFALEVSESTDGVSWSAPQTVFVTPGEIYSPTIVGTGSDPRTSGQSFYVYYGHSENWATASRRIDGTLQRRLLTLS
jgi:hypothetical protein